jgi:hypothetical protein
MKPPDDTRTPPTPLTFAQSDFVRPLVSSAELLRLRDAKLVVRVHARNTTATLLAELVVKE